MTVVALWSFLDRSDIPSSRRIISFQASRCPDDRGGNVNLTGGGQKKQKRLGASLVGCWLRQISACFV
ncbi:hypothetical protein MGG_16448 [Pyricularia oryzae 70-15]|uniref:Uncharacterized protein n=3 Tax=Pyricularia oryzae TaxID=318829 RepID=G4MPF3_PYRO7|nr:uncharacterized protein MGG_16448 [Pyricularia oryzae 70-15]EHA57997.1 hypothetical protein MGG_16448 [Pyricularia oryzae 70-15]ELQ37857.1 hypothetical protein OOU_Y34scaffold00567g4 [Pyricularia oryzae Y34]